MSEWRDLPGEPAQPPREQDPWADQPRWSDDSGPPAGEPWASDASTIEEPPRPALEAGAVASDPAAASAQADEPHSCPWCSTPAADDAKTCSNCGAALAQREKIGDLLIPGLTAVDPALEDYDKRPLHLRGPSPTQGMASGIMIAAAAGGPVGLAAIGGIAAVAAAEYVGSRGPDGQPIALEDVGKPSEAVLQALERLEDGTLPETTEPKPDAVQQKTEEQREATEESNG